MNRIFRFCLGVTLALGCMACAKSEIRSVLDDMARDTYEANEKNKRAESLEIRMQADEPLPYDQYQRERKEMMADEVVLPEQPAGK